MFRMPDCLLPTKKLPCTHKHLVATLHLRCYTSEVAEMERFADFSRKAAYSIGIPAEGTVRLPTRVRLWTVPRSPFARKSAQENFWRRTHSRVIKVFDANPEVVDRWLLFLRIHAAPGVGMKAQLFRFHTPGVGSRMTEELEAKQLSIAQRVGTPTSSSSSSAQEIPTTAQSAEQIREMAQTIVQEEMNKVAETASTDKAADTQSEQAVSNDKNQ